MRNQDRFYPSETLQASHNLLFPAKSRQVISQTFVFSGDQQKNKFGSFHFPPPEKVGKPPTSSQNYEESRHD